ncbi:hypothetical protein [Streptomyces radicis]|uniref:Uncharacterized protein n=1 Tax=Streptomyces radicis TaxID=1750517 RepID=A0A3A9W361_9ACTN|nr:hypothetical protein [Streptomyces radicis]RKN07280.1 hypothetical protein D7319_19625 [Streptomyces radicis]RKN26703.1 hypothetical protein D7318_04925 [Streptomyces radicis]
MRSFIGAHEVLDDTDFVDLALGLGTPPELWLGESGESGEERAARLDAGADILAYDPDLTASVTVLAVLAIEEYAHHLATTRHLAAARRVGAGGVR